MRPARYGNEKPSRGRTATTRSCWTRPGSNSRLAGPRADGAGCFGNTGRIWPRGPVSTEEMHTVAQTGLKTLAAQPWDFMPVAAELLIRSGHVEEAKDCIAQDAAKRRRPSCGRFPGRAGGGQARTVAGGHRELAKGRHPRLSAAGGPHETGSALTRLGDTQSAIGQLRILVADAPRCLEGHVALARLLANEGMAGGAGAGPPGSTAFSRPSRSDPAGASGPNDLLAADTGPAAEREKAWQDIENRLAGSTRQAKRALADQASPGAGRHAPRQVRRGGVDA